jgi:hypothetical protein
VNSVQRQKLKEAIEFVENYIGCGDSSCFFNPPKGMHTNGGCRCKHKAGVLPALARLYKVVKNIENE